MKAKIHILIADRNPHVREFLKRELEAAGYAVQVAERGRQVLGWVYQDEALDLLILDPDLSDMDASVLLERLQDRIPCLPVILHTFDPEPSPGFINVAAVVEKGGRSIERLKALISAISKPE